MGMNGSSSHGSATGQLVGSRSDRAAVRWSARFIVVLSVAYAAIMVVEMRLIRDNRMAGPPCILRRRTYDRQAVDGGKWT